MMKALRNWIALKKKQWRKFENELHSESSLLIIHSLRCYIFLSLSIIANRSEIY